MSELFILDNKADRRKWIGDNWADFIRFWADYYYRYSRVPDSIYWHIRSTIKLSNKSPADILSLMGAWKTGCISRQTRDGYVPAYKCNCTNSRQYYYTNRWSAGAPVAYGVWVEQLPARVKNDMKLLANQRKEDQARLVGQLANLSYRKRRGGNNVRFGLVYAITYLHFLDPIRFPVILDQHVKRAVGYLSDGRKKPNLPYSGSVMVSSVSDYDRLIVPMVDEIRKSCNAESIGERTCCPPGHTDCIERLIDKSLWAFGRYLKGPRWFGPQ